MCQVNSFSRCWKVLYRRVIGSEYGRNNKIKKPHFAAPNIINSGSNHQWMKSVDEAYADMHNGGGIQQLLHKSISQSIIIKA